MNYKLTTNIHTLYIAIILYITVLGLIATLLRGFTEINIIRYILLLNLLNNSWYIILNLHKIKLKLWTSLLFILVIISFFKGVLFNPISDRIFLDVYKPLSFIIVFQIFYSMSGGDRDLIMFKLKTRYAKFLLKASVFFGVTVVILLMFFKGYPGLRLPITVPLAIAVLNSSYLSVFALILVGLFSGKRAILVASFPALFLLIRKHLTVRKVIIFFTSVVMMFLLLYSKLDDITTSKAFNKYKYTIESFEKYKETKDLEILNQASGQRLQEIISGFHEFKSTDYIFGKGAGYSYDLYNAKRTKLIKEDYGNIHFSPASLIMSYGLLFFIILYGSFIVILIKAKRYSKTKYSFDVKILYFIVLAFFLESFFAFILFVVPFLPICLGLISNYLKNNEDDS